MPHFIALVDLTDQGIREAKDTVKRADGFIKQAEAAGVDVEGIYWTTGAHDGIIIVEAPDAATASSLFLGAAAKGNIRTQLLHAFDRSEIEACLPK